MSSDCSRKLRRTQKSQTERHCSLHLLLRRSEKFQEFEAPASLYCSSNTFQPAVFSSLCNLLSFSDALAVEEQHCTTLEFRSSSCTLEVVPGICTLFLQPFIFLRRTRTEEQHNTTGLQAETCWSSSEVVLHTTGVTGVSGSWKDLPYLEDKKTANFLLWGNSSNHCTTTADRIN